MLNRCFPEGTRVARVPGRLRRRSPRRIRIGRRDHDRQPGHRGGRRRRPFDGRGGRRGGRGRGQEGLRRGPVVAGRPGRPGGGHGPAGGGDRGPGRGHRPPGDVGDGHADPAVPAQQRVHPVRDHPVLRGPGPRHVHRGNARGGQLRRAHHGAARAGGGRGGDRFLELPAHPGVLPAGPGPGGGLHDRAQARGRDLAVRLHPGRGVRGGGLPARRLQPGHRHRPGGGDARRAPWRGHRGGGRSDPVPGGGSRRSAARPSSR